MPLTTTRLAHALIPSLSEFLRICLTALYGWRPRVKINPLLGLSEHAFSSPTHEHGQQTARELDKKCLNGPPPFALIRRVASAHRRTDMRDYAEENDTRLTLVPVGQIDGQSGILRT
jgi:hypothetical protein